MTDKQEITDQEFVENIVKALVDSPEEVVTSRSLDERGVLIQLTVNRADMGKVIGREGRTAKAIRSLLRVFGARNDSRINLKIVDPEGEAAELPEEMPARTEAPASRPTAAKPTKTETAQKTAKPTVSVQPEEKATGVI